MFANLEREISKNKFAKMHILANFYPEIKICVT